jgi:hypothetical protein
MSVKKLSAPLPMAIAMSPISEVAVAVLPAVGNKSIPSIEIWKSPRRDAPATTGKPWRTHPLSA